MKRPRVGDTSGGDRAGWEDLCMSRITRFQRRVMVTGAVLLYAFVLAMGNVGCQMVAGLGRDIASAADGISKMGAERSVYPE